MRITEFSFCYSHGMIVREYFCLFRLAFAEKIGHEISVFR